MAFEDKKNWWVRTDGLDSDTPIVIFVFEVTQPIVGNAVWNHDVNTFRFQAPIVDTKAWIRA